MTEDELKAIRERAEAAMPGPWVGFTSTWKVMVGERTQKSIADVCEYGGDYFGANTQFIAHARTDIPALLDEIDLLTRANDALGESRNILIDNETIYKAEIERLRAALLDIKFKTTWNWIHEIVDNALKGGE